MPTTITSVNGKEKVHRKGVDGVSDQQPTAVFEISRTEACLSHREGEQHGRDDAKLLHGHGLILP